MQPGQPSAEEADSLLSDGSEATLRGGTPAPAVTDGEAEQKRLAADVAALDATPTPDPAPVVAAQPTAPSAPPAVVAPPEWKSMAELEQAIQGGTVPEGQRAWLQAALSPVRAAQAEAQTARADFSAATDRLKGIAAKLEEAGVDAATVMSDEVIANHELMDRISRETVDTSWIAFEALHPEWKSIPAEHPVRARVAELSQSGEMFRLFPNEKFYSMLEKTYLYACFQSGSDPKSFLPKPAAQPASPVSPPVARVPTAPPARQDSPHARGQALVNAGEIAPNAPRRAVTEVDYDTLMNEHDHLIS